MGSIHLRSCQLTDRLSRFGRDNGGSIPSRATSKKKILIIITKQTRAIFTPFLISFPLDLPTYSTRQKKHFYPNPKNLFNSLVKQIQLSFLSNAPNSNTLVKTTITINYGFIVQNFLSPPNNSSNILQIFFCT